MLRNGKILKSRYRIIRHIKNGGMGAVYEAFDMVLKKRVIIKENTCKGEQLAFEREAQLLANLRNPSLPRCSDLFSVNKKKYFFVMDLIEEDDLSALLTKNRTPLKEETVMDWAKQLLDVLEYLHSEGILHRDIKPSNIKVVGKCVYLLDLGLAWGKSGGMDPIDESEFNWGCYSDYSPLEQLKCERTYPASDLYSLAATLYKLLTAVAPLNAATRSQMLDSGQGDPLKDIRFYNPALNRNVCLAIMRCLSIERDKRPQSVQEVRQLMFPEQTPTPEKTFPKRAKAPQLEPAVTRKSPRKRTFAGIFFFCVLLGLLIHAFADREPQRTNPAPDPPRAVATSRLADQSVDEAEQLMHSGKYEEARKKIIEALSLSPDNAYAHFIYCDLLWDIMDELAESVANMPAVQEQAEIILRLAQSPNSEKEFIARALAYLAKGKFDSALNDVDQALRLNPNSGQGLMLRGSIKYQQAVLISHDALESVAAEILDDYGRAIDKMPDYAQAYINRAQIHTMLNDFNSAVADIERAISLQPGKAGFYVELGNVYFQSKNFQEARSNYQTAIRLDQRCYKAYLGLADIFYFHNADWKNAAGTYLLANMIHKTRYAFEQIGLAYNALGQFEEAKKNFNMALQYNQNDFISHQGLARSLVGLKDFKSALDSYNNALAYAPKNRFDFLASLYRERAEVYRQLGQDGLAEEDEKQIENLGK